MIHTSPRSRRLAFAQAKLGFALDAGVHSEDDAAELWARFRYYCSTFRGRATDPCVEPLNYGIIGRVASALGPWHVARSSGLHAAVEKHLRDSRA